jgi:hypothetical protein
LAAAALLAQVLQQLQAQAVMARQALVAKVVVAAVLVVVFRVLVVLAVLVVSQQPGAVVAVDRLTGQTRALAVLAVLVLFAFIAGKGIT